MEKIPHAGHVRNLLFAPCPWPRCEQGCDGELLCTPEPDRTTTAWERWKFTDGRFEWRRRP